MLRYQYRAVDQLGKTTTGMMVATDMSDLQSKLQSEGCWLVHATEHKGTTVPTKRSGKIKPRDLILFATHMNGLLSSGVPLLSAIIGLAQEVHNPHFQQVLETTGRRVESGIPLYEAMGQFPQIFPQQMIRLTQAGEESGTLPDTFRELQHYLEWLERMKGDVRQATIYPAIILVAVSALLILLFTFVVPRFIPVLNGLNVPLPALTVFVFSLSEAMASMWWVWGLLFLGLPLGIWFARRELPSLSQWFDAWTLRLPIFGELTSLLALSRFTHNFGVLYRSGIPVLRCLNLCQGLVGNRVIASALAEVEQGVAQGSSISDCLRRHEVFPSLLLQMIAVGEASGHLDKTMLQVAAFYNEEVPRKVKQVFSILEPVITLGLIGVVGTVALSIFLPMMSLMGGLH